MCERVPHTTTLEEEGEDRPATVPAFVDELVVALTNARIYQPDHPRVLRSLESLSQQLKELAKWSGKSSLIIGTAEDYLFHDGQPLLGASLSALRLIKSLEALGSGGIRFGEGASSEEFLTLVYVLGRGTRGPSRVDDANQVLFDRGCRRIHLLSPYAELVDPDAGPRDDEHASPWGALHNLDSLLGDAQAAKSVADVYQHTVEDLQEVAIRAARGHSVSLDNSQGDVEELLKSIVHSGQSLLNLCRYEQYDAFTFGHSIRVCSLALYFASQLTDNRELLQRIGMAALMHDIGKARVPFEVLHAKGRLSQEERQIMSSHTEHGGRILLEIADSDPATIAVAFGHHDRYGVDDMGSPLQSIVTRLTKICDVYEALTAVRPYKDRMSPIRAYRIMLTMNGAFDRGLLRRFMEINGVYPVGCRVELSDGRSGRVAKQTRVLTRPQVELESAPFCPTEEVVDLSRMRGPDAMHVEQLLPETVGRSL